MLRCKLAGDTLTIEKDDDTEPSLSGLVASITEATTINGRDVDVRVDGPPTGPRGGYPEWHLIATSPEGPLTFGIGAKELWALIAYDRVDIHAWRQ